jgi:hypothetical protein
VYGTEDDALREESDKEPSDDDCGHPGPSNWWYTILADETMLFSV